MEKGINTNDYQNAERGGVSANDRARPMKLRRVSLVAGLIVAVGASAFTVIYATRGNDAVTQAQAPIDRPAKDVTPPPGETPDTSKPFWHIPYINQDEKRPVFVGKLNGYTIDPESPGRTAYDVCPGTGLWQVDPRKAGDFIAAPGPLQINPRDLPPSAGETTNLDDLVAFTCGGSLAEVSRGFIVKPGPGEQYGGRLVIARATGNDPVFWSAPQERWRPVQIDGLPAVVSRPIVSAGTKQFGACFLAIYQPKTNVRTTVWADGGHEAFCIAVAEAVIK